MMLAVTCVLGPLKTRLRLAFSSSYSPNLDLWELALRLLDKRGHDAVLVETNQDDISETGNLGEGSEGVPHHGLAISSSTSSRELTLPAMGRRGLGPVVCQLILHQPASAPCQSLVADERLDQQEKEKSSASI